MPYFGFYWDNTYILVLLGAVISMIASSVLKSNYAKYRRVYTRSRVGRRSAARRLLQSQGIYDVQVYQISGELTDHYNIRERSVGLSGDIFHGSSLASVGVAARTSAAMRSSTARDICRFRSGMLSHRRPISAVPCLCRFLWRGLSFPCRCF